MTALALLVYWVLVGLAGLVLSDLIPLDWRLTERLAASLLLGLVASTMASFGLSLWWGIGAAAALAGPALVALAALLVGWRRWLARGMRPAASLSYLRSRIKDQPLGWELAAFLVLGAALFFIFSRALVAGPTGISAGYPTVWADWSVHASYVQSFFVGHNLPPQDTLEAGTGLRYPFIVDFQPALLEELGQNLVGAMVVPSWLLSWAATLLVWHLAWRVTRRPGVASLAVALVLFGGGLGFVGLYGDGCQQLAATTAGFKAGSCTSLSAQTPAAVAAWIGHLPTELTHLARSYDGQSQAHPPLADLQWYEPLLAFWLPQRDFAFGMGLVALISILLWQAREGAVGLGLAAGIAGAALPWLNPFGYPVVGLVGLAWLWRRRHRRRLLAFLVPLLLLGLPRLAYILLGPHGQLANPLGANLFPQVELGWLSNSGRGCTAAQLAAGCNSLYLPGASAAAVGEYLVLTLARPGFWGGVAGFWLANTGVFLLLGALLLWPRRLGAGWVEERDRLGLLNFAAPYWGVFLVANVLVTQSWSWDNTKLFQYWYLGASIPVAWLLVVSANRRITKVAAGLVAVSLVLAGVLSLTMALEGQSSLRQAAPASTQLDWAGHQELEVAAAVRRRTSPRAVFLTEGQPNDPVAVLAGRPLVLGYAAWLWSYGQPLKARYAAVRRIYAGCTTGSRCPVPELLRRYRVSYVEFEPGDYNQVTVNLSWFEHQHLPVLVRTSQYLILDVRGLWPS